MNFAPACATSWTDLGDSRVGVNVDAHALSTPLMRSARITAPNVALVIPHFMNPVETQTRDARGWYGPIIGRWS